MDAYHIKNIPENLLPRERLLSGLENSLTDVELLAILLGSGTRQYNVLALSQYVLDEFSGLEGLKLASPESLQKVHGIGSSKAATILAVLEISKRLNWSKPDKKTVLSAHDAAKLFYRLVTQWEQEIGMALYLNASQQVIKSKILFQGTNNGSLFHPRDVFREAVRWNANYVIVGHTHPNGLCYASAEDRRLTNLLLQAGEVMDIPLLDHIILTEKQGYISLLAEEKER